MNMKLMLVGLLAVASLVSAQKVKSQKEAQAVQAVFSASSPDAKIAAVNDLLSKFKDTEFKTFVLEMAAEAYQQKGDSANAIIFGNRAIEADPKNIQALLLVAGQMAQGTKEFDLDKDEKIKKATKLANDAIAAVGTAQKLNPQMTEDQWSNIKKEMLAQGHETLGMLASVDKKFDVAINEFKTAVDGSPTPEPTTMARLAASYINAKRFDEGIAMADKVLAMGNVPESLKKFAQDEKTRAAKMKGGQ